MMALKGLSGSEQLEVLTFLIDKFLACEPREQYHLNVNEK